MTQRLSESELDAEVAEFAAALDSVIIPKGGYKYDKGKPLGALPFQDFPLALKKLVDVSTMGANKYKRHSWKQVEDLEERYTDALGRHFLDSFTETKDPESGIDHLAHIAWNALALLQTRIEND